MKYSQNLLLYLTVLYIAFGLFSCSEEVYIAAENDTYKKNIKTKILNNIEAQKAISLLNENIKKSNKLRMYSNDNHGMRTSGGEIDYSKILEVIDTIGLANYTFLIKNHPDDNLQTFHNLVVNLKEDSNDTKLLLMKYTMSDDFAATFYAGQTSLNKFNGSLSTSDLTEIQPCIDSETIVPPQDVVTPISGGAGSGAGSGAGPGSSSGPGSPGGTSQDQSSVPNLTPIEFSCNSCSYTTTTWAEFAKHIDPETGAPYEHTIIIDPRKNANSNMAQDPCDPNYVGILMPFDQISIDTPCIKLKNLINQISTPLTSLAGTLNQPGENGIIFNKDSNGVPSNTIAAASYGRSINIKLSTNTYGFVHTHPFSVTPMFSWGDVLTLNQVYQNAQNFNKDDVTVMVMAKSDDGLNNVLYAITISNPDLFIGLINQAYNQEELTGCSPIEKNDLLNQTLKNRFWNQSADYEKDFLRQFYGHGIELWKANATRTNWSKIGLNPYNMSLIERPCN